MKTLERERDKKKNSGFTLVEVLVAVAILAAMTAPILKSFVTVAGVNSKSRRKLTATEVAETLMESCKRISIVEFASQCDYPSSIPCTVLPGDIENGQSNFGNTLCELKKNTGTNGYSKVTTTGGYAAQLDNGAYKLQTRSDNTYIFYIWNIKMGGGTYEAVITYKLNSGRNRMTASNSTGTSINVATTLTDKSLRVLQYYDVTIDVYKGNGGNLADITAGEKLVSLDGSVTDYKSN